jgi:CRISPR-associated protein Cas5d
VERVSYDVMTPSAARGILEAIYWKPEIRWIVDRITVLKPIRFQSLRRNEVASKISARIAEECMKNGTGELGLYVEDERQQRASLVLRDVGYVIDAHFEIRGGDRNEGKHLDQARRRARDGQCFTRPFLGCREFAANFALIENGLGPTIDAQLQGKRDLGLMLHDIDFADNRRAVFFHALMRDGVIDVPPLEEACS